MEREEVKAFCQAFSNEWAHIFDIPKTTRIRLKVRAMKARGFYFNEFDDDGEYHVIALNPEMHLTKEEVYGTMAHELIHCEQRVKRIGVDHSEKFWLRVSEVANIMGFDCILIADKELDK